MWRQQDIVLHRFPPPQAQGLGGGANDFRCADFCPPSTEGGGRRSPRGGDFKPLRCQWPPCQNGRGEKLLSWMWRLLILAMPSSRWISTGSKGENARRFDLWVRFSYLTYRSNDRTPSPGRSQVPPARLTSPGPSSRRSHFRLWKTGCKK